MKTIYQILTEVLATGMTQQQVAQHIGVTQGRISIMLNKQSNGMLYEHGVKLAELHAQRTSVA